MGSMDENNLYVLSHSPLVGPLTWKFVADQMRQRDINVIVPTLTDSPNSENPFWKQHADSVAQELAQIPKSIPITWVTHSGAGPIVPAIRQLLASPVNAYVFVDAGVPRNGASRLDLMKSEDSDWAQEFQQYLEGGGRFPNWSADDLREIIPDTDVREQMMTEIRPRGLSFFTEPIPVFDGWPDAPCIYVQFSAPYKTVAAQARQLGWPTYEFEAGHFHMLVDPEAVTNMIVEVANR